jgi:hypothetical protein
MPSNAVMEVIQLLTCQLVTVLISVRNQYLGHKTRRQIDPSKIRILKKWVIPRILDSRFMNSKKAHNISARVLFLILF